MPTYLCHGFRWKRPSIRVFVIVQDLDDASPEWIIPPKISQCFLEAFYNIFEFLPYRAPPSRNSGGWSAGPPSAASEANSSLFNTAPYTTTSRSGRSRSQSAASRSRSKSGSRSRSRQPSNPPAGNPPPPLPDKYGANNHERDDDIASQAWSVVKLLEEYDPTKLDEISRPYAYVADYVKRIDLSVSIADEIHKYEEQLRGDSDPPVTGQGSDEASRKKSSSSKKLGWFEKLRDQLQRGEEIRWYVVVNGDEVRDWADDPDPRPSLSQRPTPTKSQKEHHAQYTLQQRIFEQNDRKRAEEQKRADRLPQGENAGKPAVPEKDLPRLRTNMAESSSGGQPQAQPRLSGGEGQPQPPQLRPKSSGRLGGGFRRLFGKNSNKPDGKNNNKPEDY